MTNVERTGARSSQRTQRSLGGIGQKLTSIAFLAKTAFGSAMVMGARNAVREFAQLEGAMAKFDVVFGDQAREVEAWVNQFREGVPLARREIIAAAASMQDLLVPMGVAREDASQMTKEWLELAAALAAFNDVPVDQALEAIRSGIAGQSRPLRQFGIDVRETALQQTALEEGLIKSGEAMSDTVRQQALLTQAYRQSKDAVDGYEDQLGSTLIMEQELGAQYKDTSAIIGEMLQPVYNEMLESSTMFLKQLSGDLRMLQFITKAITGNIETLTDRWNKFLQIPTADLDIDTVTSQMKSLRHEMDAMIQRQGERGISEDAVRASEQYQILEKRLLVVRAILDEVSKRTAEGMSDFNESTEQTSKTVGELKEEISDLEDKINDSFDPKEIAKFKFEIEELEIELQKLMGEFDNTKPKVEAIPPLYDQIFPSNLSAEKLLTDLEQAEKGLDDLLSGTEDFSPDKITEDLSEATGAARFFSRTLADGLEQVLFNARSVEDALKGIARQLASRALTTLLFGAFTGGFGGAGFFGAMFGGFRSSGGSVMAGQAYRINENNQQEMFMPSTNGQVISPRQMQGSSISPMQIEQAFLNALDKKLKALPPRAIYGMAEKGRFDY